MRKFTEVEIKKLKKHWEKLQKLEDEFYKKVDLLESVMQDDLDISDVEFFMSDGEYVGIGNITRTIKLLQSDKLEKK